MPDDKLPRVVIGFKKRVDEETGPVPIICFNNILENNHLLDTVVRDTTITTPHFNNRDGCVVRPYLVFRSTIKDLKGTKSISESIDFDYMGSSEFEWGAPAKSRLRMWYYYINGVYRKHRVDSMKLKDGSALRVYHRFTDDDLQTYLKYLREYADGKFRMKEWIDFDNVVKGTSRWNGKFDFWWDIENDCYFSFNKTAINKMPEMVEETIKRMQGVK